MNNEFFIENRNKVKRATEKGSLILLLSGSAPQKIGDEDHLFTQNRNFYYLTGLNEPNQALVMYHGETDTETLYIQRDNGDMAKWVGANMTAQTATQISGVTTTANYDEFTDGLAQTIFKNNIEIIYLDLERRTWNQPDTEAIRLAKEIKNKYPYIQIKNIYHQIGAFRSLKCPDEVEEIKKAIAVTKEGIENMMKNAKAGMMEYEIESYFDFSLTKNGVRDKAFPTIAAAGHNGTILHYNKNNTQTKENDLILCDLGAAWHNYNADITRTFPVNGKFTDRQKQIYNIVLEGQQVVIDAIKPGLPFKRLNELLKEFYATKLKEIGLIKEDSELVNYYYHGVSHMLGLETHDIGRGHEGNITEGMVFTVEPGLYIEQEQIGIRIEDDILVTKDGAEVLSKEIIKTVEDIENFMR